MIVKNSGSNLTLKEGFDIFINYKVAVDDYVPATVKFHKERFKYFTEFISEDTPCSKITKDIMTNYNIYILNEKPNLTKNSRVNYLKPIRTFLYFLMKNGYVEEFFIEIPKEEEIFKENYTENEMDALLKRPKNPSFAEYRNWVIINFIYGTSARSRTVREMKISDIDFDNDLIYERNMKTKKPQVVPLTPQLKKILKEYIATFEHTGEEYLFPQVFGGMMSENGFKTAIKRYNLSRGVTKTSPHLIRHTFATQYCANGGSEATLQRILGHSTPKMTQHYINMSGRDLKKNFGDYSPLELKTAKQKKAIRMKK